jgi:hypothetical protein
MKKFKYQKLELLFEFLLSKGWQPEEAMNKMDKVNVYVNQHGNFVAEFKDGTTNTFTVEHVPKFFET